MTFEIILFLTSGTIAIVAGVIVLVHGPGRPATLLSGFALALLGLNQIGWARTVYTVDWGERNQWFELTLGLSMAVTLAWLLLSVVLARGTMRTPQRGWRFYIGVQAVLALAVIVLMGQAPPALPPMKIGGDAIFPLTWFGRLVFGILLANVALLAANFEATYLGLSLRARRLFRAGLVGILICAGFYAYLLTSALWTGRLPASDLSLGAIPVTAISFLFPISLIRGRIAEATMGDSVRPVYKTASLLAGIGVLLGAIVLVQLTRATGWSLARTLWTVSICGTLVGLLALAVSNRVQRRVHWALEPYIRRRLDPEGALARLTNDLDSARSIEDLIGLIPSNAHAVAGVNPVTLFLADRARSAYVPVGSTLPRVPSEPFGMNEPLPRELRKSVRAIHLIGRSDDLEYIPIYVENSKQITACEAVSAVPLVGNGELMGFLMCGNPEEGPQAAPERNSLLSLIASHYSARLELLIRRSDSRGGTKGEPAAHP